MIECLVGVFLVEKSSKGGIHGCKQKQVRRHHGLFIKSECSKEGLTERMMR